MRKMKILAIVCAVAMAAFATTGCGGKKDNAMRLRYWGDLAEVSIIEEMVKNFQAANPSVEIKAERKPADSSYADTLITEFAAGTAPDVIFISTDNVDQMVNSGQLADLTPFLDKDQDIKIADWYQNIVARFSRGNAKYVLPRDIAPIGVVYYNKNMFDAAKVPYPTDDWTWEDMRSKALALTKRNSANVATQLGYADDWNLVDNFILSAGGKMVDDFSKPGRITADSPEAISGVVFRWKLLQVDKVMPSASDNQTLNGGSMAMFQNGQLGMFLSGIWKTPTFRQIKTFDWDMVMFPKGPSGKRGFLSGGSGYAMKKDTKHAELAWKLIKALGGPEGQKQLAKTGLAQPAIKSLAASPVFLDDQKPKNKKVLLEAAEVATFHPVWDRWIEFQNSVWNPSLDPIWVKGFDGDVSQMVKDAVKAGNDKFFPAKK
jgi:multiple sugar transport system substrate-binding protein